MREETLFEKLGVKYIEKDGIFYPLIALCCEEKSTDVGKYGHMWIDYIRTEYPQRYKSLVRFDELHDKAAEVNEVAYELLEEIEKEWLSEHKPKQANSFVEMYRLRTQAIAGVIGVLIVIVEKKVTKAYRENCWDVISVGVAVISLAVAVYFGDWIKFFVKLNLVALLLLVQAVYVGIREYVKGCKRARGYY